MDKTPWLFINSATADGWLLVCGGCGDRVLLQLPCSFRTVTPLLDAFRQAHDCQWCKERWEEKQRQNLLESV